MIRQNRLSSSSSREFPVTKTLKSLVTAYSCAGSGGLSPPSLLHVARFSIVPVRFVYRRDTWPTRHRMGIDQNSYFENFLEDLRFKNLLGCSCMNGPAVFHQQNVVRKLRREIDVVCDDER